MVIPAYNEGGKLFEVLENIQKYFENIVVVDDGSIDNTDSILINQKKIKYVQHPINLGQGAALQTGIQYALDQGAEWLVTMDADGQHDPEDALKMLHKAQQEHLDVCFGSRFLGATIGMPYSRKLILKTGIVFQSITTGMRMTDVHNGLRIISGKAAYKINMRQNRMAHASEIISICKSLSLKIDEYPVTVRYTEYSKSKGQSSVGAIAILADIILAKLGKS